MHKSGGAMRCSQWCVRSLCGRPFQGFMGRIRRRAWKGHIESIGEIHVKFKIPPPKLLINLLKKLPPYYSLVENHCKVMGGDSVGKV